jgi:excinuclease UvrABC nuclease subunit
MENGAFNKQFLNKISKSTKLEQISTEDEINKYLASQFSDLNHMQDFYNSLLDEIKEITLNKSKSEISKELNDKLDSYIREEKFEEAAKLRDYMQKNSIKRKNKS